MTEQLSAEQAFSMTPVEADAAPADDRLLRESRAEDGHNATTAALRSRHVRGLRKGRWRERQNATVSAMLAVNFADRR